MCKYGQLIMVNTLANDEAWIDACISGLIAEMNLQGIRTLTCTCGHGKFEGGICVDPESIELLNNHGYKWIWPKDDQTRQSDSEKDIWFRSRKDIVIVVLPKLDITWGQNDPTYGGYHQAIEGI